MSAFSEPKLLRLPVAGLKFHDYDEVKHFIKMGLHLTLEAEPTNPYDENAVKVMLGNKHLGYIPATDALSVSTDLLLYQHYEAVINFYFESAPFDEKIELSIEFWDDNRYEAPKQKPQVRFSKAPSGKKFPWYVKAIFIILGLAFVRGLIGNSDKSPEPISEEQKLEKAKQDSIQARAEATKQTLSNIRYFVKKTIKDNLKDPDSFEEIEHQEFQVTNPTPLMYYQAKIKYRAKNSFGGYNVEQWCFNFLENGTVTKSFECD